MPDLGTKLLRLRNAWLPILVLLGGIAALIVLGTTLAWRGSQEMRDFASSRSDNLVYTVTQTEVELRDFEQKVLLFMLRDQGGAPDLRDAFDVFYSRLSTLRVSPLYQGYIVAAGQSGRLEELGARADALLPVIDGDDAALLAATGQILPQLELMRQDLRAFASRVTQTVAKRHEEMRVGVFAVMRSLAYVVAGLLGLMAVFSLLVWSLFRIIRSRARDLQQTSTRLSTIVTTSPDAIVVADGDGLITEFNVAAEALFGLTREAAIGQPMTRLCDASALNGPVRRQRVTGFRYEGGELPLEASLGAEKTPFGCVRVYVFRDITHRLAIEEDLRQSRDQALAGERAKARFVAVMSHEMRTPLNGIIGAIDLLRDELTAPRARQYLDILENAGETLLANVNDVLDITELETTNVRLAQQVVDLDALSGSVLGSFEQAARARDIRLERLVHLPGSQLVCGDRARLRQILTNLVDNAVKHTSGGTVTLEISGVGPGAAPMIEIQVADTGAGIAQDDQQRIFEDFVRLEWQGETDPGGTGLGLGITRRLVGAMGGQISVESAPGEGSLFVVRLPLPALPPGTEACGALSTGAEQEPAAPLRVLVVEDNPVNRFILRQMLEKDGHRMEEAENGADGLALAESRQFDLILMDIAMPGMDGDAVTRAIRAGGGPNAGTRIVAFTAHVQAADNASNRVAGFDQILTKPVTWPVLRAVLKGKTPQSLPPDAALPVLDPAALAALSGSLGEQKCRAFLDGFGDEGRELLAMLARGNAERDPLRRRVHALAGAAAILGARRLHGALSELETALSAGDAPKTPSGLATLFDDTLAALHPATDRDAGAAPAG